MNAPLTPPDCDLRDFQFMPVDIVRLFSSEFHARANDAEWRAGVTLWLKSFHQVPAASLPDDDVQLCRLAELGRDLKTWRKLRDGALHGWVRADDGRMYHPVVAEKANEAWDRKKFQRERSRRASEARWSRTDRDAEPAGSSTSRSRTKAPVIDDAGVEDTAVQSSADASSMLGRYQGTGIGTGKSSVSDETVSDGPSKADLDAIWALAPAKGRERSSRKDLERAVKAAVKRGHSVDEVREGVEAYYASREATKDGGEYAKGVHRIVENDRWQEFSPSAGPFETPEAGGFATGILAPSEARQRIWMGDWKAGADWKTGDRGPKPGEAGCRVSPEILAEFGFTQGRAA